MAKKIKDILANIGYEVDSAIRYIIDRPIGIVNKQFHYAQTALNYDPWFGGGDRKAIGSPKGSMVNIEYKDNAGWFNSESERNLRKKYSTYIEYIEKEYYGGNKNVTNGDVSFEDIKTNNSLKEDVLSSGLAIMEGFGYPISVINPNTNDSDTRLGEVNAYFLNLSQEYKETTLDKRYKSPHWITQNAYSSSDQNIDIDVKSNGEYGIYNAVTNQNEVENISSQMLQYTIKSLNGYDLKLFREKEFTLDNLSKPIKAKTYSPVEGMTYLDKIGVKSALSNNRYNFKDVGNTTYSSRQLQIYAEAEGGVEVFKEIDETLGSLSFAVFKPENGKKDLLSTTYNNFKNSKYDTLIARFCTGPIDDDDITSTAVSKGYGMSHGRNLLSGNGDVNGYNNPYCRVWTFHHQYASYKDTMRAKKQRDNILKSDKLNSHRTSHGTKLLKNHGVIGENGFIKFTSGKSSTKKGDGQTRCMFSIENLAWSDYRNRLDPEQIGPNNGRIMWFPPYDLKFNENVNANWGEVDFIGRGERIYTYTNTDRSGTLSFKLLIDHPSMLNDYKSKGDSDTSVEIDDIDSADQKLLRFFAGCDLGKFKQYEEPEDEDDGFPDDDDITPPSECKQLKFQVFYPNNYSGRDDNQRTPLKPITYLLNGVVCDIIQSGSNSNGAKQEVNNEAKKVWVSGDKTIGGYEMRADVGISVSGGSEPKDSTIEYKEKNGKKLKAVRYQDPKNKNVYWGHRIDRASEGELLVVQSNYSDVGSHCLNYSGYTKAIKEEKDVTWCSFYDMFRAIHKEKVSNIEDTESTKITMSNMDKWLKNKSIKSIHINGYATNQGKHHKNNELAYNRCLTVKKWLSKYIKDNDIEYKLYKIEPNKLGAETNNEKLEVKSLKCALVTIYYNEDSVTPASKNGSATQNIITEGDVVSQSNKKSRRSGTTSKSSTKKTHKSTNIVKTKKSNKTKTSSSTRYSNEYDFFQQLSTTNPLVFKQITNKIKYFDPAFHTMTPEGFQARLTFLHQCTRQGGTHSASDIGTTTTADNLSFGRPPVCILRIGDFYHTKIIIKSLNIKYDQASWDLNPEGIGVMPMLADIDINFIFIGGSDLAGPVARLQNAISFNYYANTRVYDNRAEESND